MYDLILLHLLFLSSGNCASTASMMILPTYLIQMTVRRTSISSRVKGCGTRCVRAILVGWWYLRIGSNALFSVLMVESINLRTKFIRILDEPHILFWVGNVTWSFIFQNRFHFFCREPANIAYFLSLQFDSGDI